jgi:hypothetical protein
MVQSNSCSLLSVGFFMFVFAPLFPNVLPTACPFTFEFLEVAKDESLLDSGLFACAMICRFFPSFLIETGVERKG